MHQRVGPAVLSELSSLVLCGVSSAIAVVLSGPTVVPLDMVMLGLDLELVLTPQRNTRSTSTTLE